MAIDPIFFIPRLSRVRDVEGVLEEHIRKRILSGVYAGGMRLPNTLEWAARLKVNDRRVQRVLSRLAAQGFLERRPRYGTFVRYRKKRSTVAILVGYALVVEHLHHLRKMVEFFLSELGRLGYQAEVIDDLFSVLTNDFDDHQMRVARLRSRLQELDPSGYIECSFDLSRLQDLYPAFDRPLVSFYPTSGGGDVYFDTASFIHESLKYLASKGRRKVLFIRSAGRLGAVHQATSAFWDAVKKFGFTRGAFRELYHGSITDSMEEEAFRWTLQLVKSWHTLRKNYIPDCLIVGDDIVMRGIAAGLRQTGIRVPQDLLVVVQANEGVRFPYGIPVVRCEISLHAMAQSVVELLDARITKRKLPRTPILLSKLRFTEALI